MSFIVRISVVGIALGTATLIIALAILSGFERTLTNTVVGYASHAEILSYNSRGFPDMYSTEAFLKQKVPMITSVEPFVASEVVLRSPRGISGLLLRGVSLKDASSIGLRRIIRGKAERENDTLASIIISAATAAELRTDTGKTIIAFRLFEGMKSRDEVLANSKRFRITGIYETGMTEYDKALAYTSIGAAQQMLHYSDERSTGFSVWTSDVSLARSLADTINAVMRYPIYATSIYDMYQTIFAWIDLQKKPIPIILGLIILVAAFNIISTLLILVMEKTRSIAVLKSLGAHSRTIAGIFITEGGVIAVIGTVLGNIIALILSYLQQTYQIFKLNSDIYFMSSVPISIDWQHYVIVSFVALLIALTASVIPARIASRIAPARALHFG
jgi:lipoprotein-releasing system permease protein